MPRTPKPDTRPSAATIATYAGRGPEQLAAPGDDLPDEATLRAEVDHPERNRFGIRPVPADLLPMPIVRAFWRWDRAADLAADMEARAAQLAGDTTLDAAAADADLALVLAGTPAHHAADLAHRRDSTTRAAADLRARATTVAEDAHTVCVLDTEADPSRPTLPALHAHLRDLVGAEVAEYLATLDRLATLRAEIASKADTIADWWRRAAHHDHAPTRRPPVMAALVTLPADLVSVTLDGVRNPTHIGVPFAEFVDAERAALTLLATA